MKSKVILFCVLLFCSKIVDSTPHSEDLFRHPANQPSNWHVDQTAHDAQYIETDFAQTQNINPLTNPAIQQDSNEDYYSNQQRYNYDGYGYNKSPVELPSGKQLLNNYNTQVDGRRLESYPHRVDSYPSQIGFNSHQFRNPNWRSQNQYPNSVPSGVLINESERPLVNTVREPYRGPVQYPQPKYVPSSNRPLNHPDRSFLRREQFQHPLVDNAGDGKYIANPAHRFGSSGPIPYDSLSEGQAGVSDVNSRLRGGQRHLQNLVAQAANLYNEVPAVIAETLADPSENIKYLENYRSPSDFINTAPSNNYNDVSPVIPEVETFGLESGENNAPISYESHNNGQVAASDIKTRLTGSRRNSQSFAPQTGTIYEESPAVIPTDTLEERIDRSRADLGNTAQITNYDNGSPAISSADHYSSGSRPNNVRVPYEVYSEAQAAAFEVKPRPTGGRRYVQNIAPQSRQMHVPAVIATDILADQSKTIIYDKRGNSKPRSESIDTAPLTNQEDSSPVISEAGNINAHSGPSSSTPGNTENKVPVDISKTLSDRPLARKYAHRTESGSNNIVPDDSYNSAPTVISETVQEKSEEKPILINSETSSASTDTERDVPAHRSGSSIPLKPSSEITEFSLVNLLSKTDLEKFMAGNTKRFLVIHPNKTVEYVDNIDADSHQNSKLRLVNKKPKHGEGIQLPENVKDNPVVENDSNPLESSSNLKLLHPHAHQAESGRLKPISPLSKPLTPHQAEEGDSPSKPLDFPENQPEENKYFKPLRSNIRHPAHNYKSKTIDVNQPRDHNSNPSFAEENQQVVETNIKPQPLIENQSADDDISNSSSTVENQPGDDNSFMPPSPYKRGLAHYRNSKLSQVDQLTKDYNSQPSSSDGSVPSHIHKSQPSADDNVQTFSSKSNESVADDSEPLHLHKRKPVRPYKPKHIHLNQPEDVNNANSLSLSEDKPPGDSYNKSIHEDQSDDDKKSYSYKKQSADENQPAVNNHLNPTPSYSSPENKPGISKSPDVNQPANENQPSDGTQPAIEQNSKPKHSNDYEPGNDNNSTSSTPGVYQPVDDSGSSPSSSKDNHYQTVTKHKPSHPSKKQLSVSQKPKSEDEDTSPENNARDENNSDSLVPEKNQPKDDSSATPSDEQNKKSKQPRTKKPEHKKKLKHPYVDQSENYESSPENKLEISKSSFPDVNQPANENQLSDGTQPAIHQNSKPKHSNDYQPGDENVSASSNPSEYNSVDDSGSSPSSSKDNQDKTVTKHKPSHPSKKQSSVSEKPKSEDEDTSPENNTGDENNSDSFLPEKNQPKDDRSAKPSDGQNKKSKQPQTKKPEHKKKLKHPYVDQSENYESSPENKLEISESSSPDENQPSNENQPAIIKNSKNDNHPGDENNSTPSTSGEYQPDDDSSSSPSSKENQDKAITKPKSSHPHKEQSSVYQKSEDEDTNLGNDTGDENNSDSLSTEENQPKAESSVKSSDGKNKKSKPLQHKRKPEQKNKLIPWYTDRSENDDSFPENEPGDEKNSKSSSPYDNETEYDSKPTPPVVSKIDSTTESPTTPNYTTSSKPQVSKKHKDRQIRRKSTTSSPTVSSTTPSSEETSEDKIITISPIEQITDNVSDFAPMTTSTTTVKPIETPEKSDTNKYKNNEEDDNSTNSSSENLDNNSDKSQASTTTASPSSSTTLADYTSGDKTTKTVVENNDKQTNDNAVESQVSKEKKDIQTVQSAVYNSNELLDTNTEGPAESDVYSPVTTSPSTQNDVNTGDATSDDTLELEQPETDVTITVSSNTDNDSEDDVITINVEVSESAGSSDNDKTLLINIDTHDDSDDDSNTSLPTPAKVGGQSSDCKQDHNDDDGKGKNLEIDMSNIRGEPTMWIRTTNQDIIEKLTDKNDTAFDIVYFFNMVTQPVIEREKETTFYCNGTVSITIKETTYPNKDDPTPNIEKKTQTMQIEDYKRYGQEKSSD